jgi:hypothetical protein
LRLCNNLIYNGLARKQKQQRGRSMKIATLENHLAMLFASVAAGILGYHRKLASQATIQHVLYEHFPDGKSRIVGRWNDARCDIPENELGRRFTAAIAKANNPPTFEDRAQFLRSNYLDMRGWLNRPPTPAAAQNPSLNAG